MEIVLGRDGAVFGSASLWAPSGVREFVGDGEVEGGSIYSGLAAGYYGEWSAVVGRHCVRSLRFSGKGYEVGEVGKFLPLVVELMTKGISTRKSPLRECPESWVTPQATNLSTLGGLRVYYVRDLMR